jgi:hypothetical protein
MANNLTDVAENTVLNAINGVAASLYTTPLKLRLMTANGTDAANGTEVTGGSYVSQTIVFTTATTGTASNTAQIQYAGMPACTVVGFEIWDSNATPKRIWQFPATTNRVVNAGDTYNVAIGAIVTSLD